MHWTKSLRAPDASSKTIELFTPQSSWPNPHLLLKHNAEILLGNTLGVTSQWLRLGISRPTTSCPEKGEGPPSNCDNPRAKRILYEVIAQGHVILLMLIDIRAYQCRRPPSADQIARIRNRQPHARARRSRLATQHGAPRSPNPSRERIPTRPGTDLPDLLRILHIV